MRTIACIVAPFALAATTACNTSTTGDQNRLQFTPINCGNPLLGCDLASGLIVGGELDLEVRGLEGISTDGLTLSTSTTATVVVLEVLDAPVRTFSLRGLSPGTARLEAHDANGDDVDSLTFNVADADRLALHKIAGEATGPTAETGVDEAWAVDADALVSFQAVAMKEDYWLIGRLAFLFSEPTGNSVLTTEQSSSDRPSGYLYVQPPAGDYRFAFTIDGNPAFSVDVALHAR
jgi:hypothetical protein